MLYFVYKKSIRRDACRIKKLTCTGISSDRQVKVTFRDLPTFYLSPLAQELKSRQI